MGGGVGARTPWGTEPVVGRADENTTDSVTDTVSGLLITNAFTHGVSRNRGGESR